MIQPPYGCFSMKWTLPFYMARLAFSSQTSARSSTAKAFRRFRTRVSRKKQGQDAGSIRKRRGCRCCQAIGLVYRKSMGNGGFCCSPCFFERALAILRQRGSGDRQLENLSRMNRLALQTVYLYDFCIPTAGTKILSGNFP